MSKTKAFALAGMLSLAGAGIACSSGVGEKSGTTTANTNKPAATAPAAPAAPAPTTIAGMSADTQQIYSNKCAMCHGPDAKGIKGAPNLLEVKDKHTATEWESYLKNTKIWDKNNTMPIIPLTADESKKLSEWLAATTGKAGSAGDEKADKNAKSEGMKKP